ncbi:MAG: SpoIVB peptidase S55 domain-containing protein [Vicinamibacterales bacterium]|nr:SpoIVB peptidase S55 domain-containing protein [Vicinamibacterales bacterium]
MTFRRLSIVAMFWIAWLLGMPAAERHMDVSAIKPGMVGTGRTVFRGTTLEDFQVHILGVLRNTIAPNRDLILAKLEGGPLKETGVIAGMSGSPVYVDGRLIGAVSYSLGSFTTEPIAGITPIAEMLDAARATVARRPAVPVSMPAFVTGDTFQRVMAGLSAGAPGTFAAVPSDVRVLPPAAVDLALAARLRPIATPLNVSGLAPASAAVLLDALAGFGFVGTPSAGGAPQASASVAQAALRPGDPVGVTLVSGDYNVGATGTVTDVDGGSVYAFGHPFFGLGPTRLPMTTAYVHTILPSLMSSTKVASTGDVIGVFTQDRATVLAGTLGAGPDTIPVSVTLTSAAGQKRTLRFAMIEDPFFTPLLAFVGVGSALSTFERDLGTNTYAVRARIAIRGQAAISFDDVLTGDGAASAAASSIAVPIAALVTNDREPVRIEHVSIELTTVERARVSTIQRVWVDAVDIKPGTAVPVKIVLRPYRGADEIRTVKVDVPASAEGPLTLVVADGSRLAQLEQRDGLAMAAPASLAQLVSQIQRVKRHNRVYVRLYAHDAGAVVGGEPMPGLPNSVLAVIDGDRASSGTSSTSSALIGAWDIPVEFAVSGLRSVTVTPLPALRRP